MVLFLDDYITEDPKRQIAILRKFESCKKNLHEMTAAEVNEFAKSWQPVIKNTANKQRRYISQYLNWLAKRGESIVLCAADIKIPVTAQFEHYIFSTDDIHAYFEKLCEEVELTETQLGYTDSTTESLYMPHAVGVLAFYGLTAEQIFRLDLSDVQPDGVAGYDLPLTPDDIDTLMQYQALRRYSNYRALLGTKYIRSINSESIRDDSRYFTQPLSRLVIRKEAEYLKPLLSFTTLSLMGKFNRVYQHEQKNGTEILKGKGTPDWFCAIMEIPVGSRWVTERKKEYIKYRAARETT